MTKITRTCDRCKKEVEQAKDLNSLRLVATNSELYSYSTGQRTELNSTIPAVEWCRDCCTTSGFMVYKNTELPHNSPTFEEMLREMVDTAVAERTQS